MWFFPWVSVFVAVYPGTHRPTQVFRVGDIDAGFPASEDEERRGQTWVKSYCKCFSTLEISTVLEAQAPYYEIH